MTLRKPHNRDLDNGSCSFEMTIDGQSHTGTACPDEPGHRDIRG
ncbi:hypothetical protein [Thioalkalivibrio sp. ALMg13-2]|nr:hypothetical protein [Thioalkalivibrio sp. ALMg13-2]